jgi:hypothetical protein
MQPAIIQGHNRTFSAPSGCGGVGTLFVRAETDDGLYLLRSAWEAEQGEVGFLLAGAKLHLGINAQIHPIVNLRVSDLPEDFQPVMTARRLNCPARGPIARVEAIIPHPPHGLRIWVERPILDGFAAAFVEGVVAIVEQARERGFDL